MSNADLLKFRELLISDVELQQKLKTALENYAGEQNEKAVFDNILLPLGQEYGKSFLKRSWNR